MASEGAETRYNITGMDCAACAAKITNAAHRFSGVDDVAVSVMGGSMTLRHRRGLDLAPLEQQISKLGYAVSPASRDAKSAENAHDEHVGAHHTHSHERPGPVWWRTSKGLLTIASGAGLVTAFVIGKALPALGQWPFIAAMLIGLVPVAKRALSAAASGFPFSIETLMTIAAIGAVMIGAGEEAATVVFLFLVGELLEGVAASKARASIQALSDLTPKTALVEMDGKIVETPAEKIQISDIVIVRPGDRIAADGAIIEGKSDIDESPVTGESIAVRKERGAKAFAGTINGEGLLRITATSSAADNTIARIIRLVEEAQEAKAPMERFIDRFSSYYTPAVLVVGALVAILPPLLTGAAWSEWIYKGLAVLLIGCPCALVISTPAAIAAALSSGARQGLLIKGGAVLETIGKVTAACFDKTGTLTEGKPKVTDVVAFAKSEAEVLRLAGGLEQGSNHPLALGILAAASDRNLTVPAVVGARTIGGKGVEGIVEGVRLFLGSPGAADERAALTDDQRTRISQLNDEGKTVSLLLAGDDVAGAIAMRDEPRPDAKSGLLALKTAGVKLVMLTGDNRRAADAIGRQLGIEALAELLPEGKQRIVAEMRKQGLVVAKIGDGVNDAPALAAADVGIAMGGGADVALETADAAILHGRVMDIARMMRLSKSAMTNIRQNIAIAIGLKAIFLATTILGVTGLWPAILADTGATVLVTANALRLLRPDTASLST